ncbi:MAG: hypothetical protein ABFR90_00045 [Planctomycetota bacterium]
MRISLNILYSIALALYSPKVLHRRLFQGRYRGGWDQRTGYITRGYPNKQ